MSSISEMNK